MVVTICAQKLRSICTPKTSFPTYFQSAFSLQFIFLIALTANYNHLRLHCSLGKVLVSYLAISALLVYWLGKSETFHSCFHSSLLDSVFI